MAAWRPMRTTDLPAVEVLAGKMHPDLPESREVFAERLALFPDGALVLDDGDDTVYGYILSYPIVKDYPPSLDSLLTSIDEKADTYYIHDIVISTQLRGRGHAAAGVSQALRIAAKRGYADTCLISVYDTTAFWGRYGFEKEAIDGVMAEKLREYGPDAVYMTRRKWS